MQQQRHLQAGRADALGIDDAVAAVLGHEVRQVRVHEMRVQVRQRVAAVVVVVTDVERRAFAGRAVEDRVERVHVLDAVFAGFLVHVADRGVCVAAPGRAEEM